MVGTVLDDTRLVVMASMSYATVDKKKGMRLRAVALIALFSAVDAGWALAGMPPGKWWLPEPLGYQHALRLGDAQAKRIAGKVQSFLPWLEMDLKEVRAAESVLHTTMCQGKSDDVTKKGAIERLRLARRRLAVTRETLWLQVRRLLTVEQRNKLEEILARTTE